MWNTIISLFVGGIGGYLFHAVSMKVSFKQRTIDNKIKVYDGIIRQWVLMRNFVFHKLLPNPIQPVFYDFDKLYGDSQTFIGEAVLVSEDTVLVEDINNLNERLYRTVWTTIGPEKVGEEMEDIKRVAIRIIKRMQEDIKRSTIFEFSDFLHICSGLNKTKH